MRAEAQGADGGRETEDGADGSRPIFRLPSSVALHASPTTDSPVSARPLTVERDAQALQALYDRCVDFALLSDGEPAAPTAGRNEFTAVPEGWTLADKFVFGVFAAERLIAVIEGIRHYPEPGSYWLGLLLLDPDHRRQGLGSASYRAFESWARAEGAGEIQLTVIEDNAPALAFWSRMGFARVHTSEPKRHGKRVYAKHFMSKALQPVRPRGP
jgi:GNAT superfamily N-acetyltransferase